jgi:Fe(II)/alpha-ketoglutarate-dependent arginine beta-hydroxylase
MRILEVFMESVQVRVLKGDIAADLEAFAVKLAAEFKVVSNSDFVRGVPEYAEALGEDIARQCRPPDDSGLFVLRGLPIDDARLGPTPPSWAYADTQTTAVWDIALLLLASVIGQAFGWEGQQDGRLVHDIVPIPGHEREQTGSSSTVLLSPHTEDAFHPRRADFVLLGCLRNPEGIATHAASIRRARISEDDYQLLSQPELPILPDKSYSAAQGHRGDPPKVRTLWRTDEEIFMRFDPAYSRLERADAAYRAAYRRLGAELERVTASIRLRCGDVLVMDNDVVVHGREPFRARYDGTDRWLKRISVHKPGRAVRPPDEAAEDGYGQAVADPYA